MEARQRVKLSLTNRSKGLISRHIFERHTQRQDRTGERSHEKNERIAIRPRSLKLILDSRICLFRGWPTWWS